MDPGAKRLFKGPKGPLGPLGPERSDFFKGPKGPLGPLAPPVAREIWYPWSNIVPPNTPAD